MSEYDRGFADGAREKDTLIRMAREKAIKEVLETIDRIAQTSFAAEDYHQNEEGKCVIQLMREEVVALLEDKTD